MNFLPALKKHFGYTAFPAVAGGDRARRARGARRFRPHADRGREVALFSAAGLVARWPDDRGFAPHLADERPGRRPPGERRGGDILEFRARWDASPLAAARTLQRRVPAALRRAGAAHARFVHREGERAGTSRRSRSTKRIASANGATISGRNIASWPGCGRSCLTFRSWP